MLHRKPTALRIRRIALGLRIRDVANRTRLSDARISEIERGEGRPPDPYETAAIEDFLVELEVDVADILPGVRVGRGPRGLA